MKNIPQLIDYFEDKFPEVTAIHDRGTEIPYQDLARRSRQLAAGLLEKDIKKGDRVGLWLPNITAYMEAFLACASVGAIVVSVNTKFKSFEMEDVVSRAGCKMLILWPTFKNIPFLKILSEISADTLEDLETIVFYGEGEDMPPLPEELSQKDVCHFKDLAVEEPQILPLVDEADGLVIFTTSGTTGKPKFVLHSHMSVVLHAIEVVENFEYTNKDCKLLQAIPLCGTFGLTQAIAGLVAGATVFCLPVFDPAEGARLLSQYKITDMNGSDDMYAMLLDHADAQIPFPNLKQGGFAAFNPAQSEIVERAEARGIKLYGLWGMSEVQAFVTHQAPDAPSALRKRAGGRLISPSAQLRITDPETAQVLPHGENGEIEIKTLSQMTEYFLNPEATQQTITDDGFIKTGDLGFQEDDRSFVFLSRMGDVLRLGGYLTDPAEIENCLQERAEIHQAQVVGVETKKGTRAFAFVTGDVSFHFNEEDLIRHCTEKLAKYKVPVAVYALDRFPMTESANGIKIQRSKLRKDAARVWLEKGHSP